MVDSPDYRNLGQLGTIAWQFLKIAKKKQPHGHSSEMGDPEVIA
jgi:hypothetical protein